MPNWEEHYENLGPTEAATIDQSVQGLTGPRLDDFISQYGELRKDPQITHQKAKGLGGIFGMHYFYLGHPIIGLLALGTGNGFLLGWFWDMRKSRAEKLTKTSNDLKMAKLSKSLRRREELAAKYGSDEYAKLIVEKMFAQGMTDEMLVESIGKPSKVDREVLKTKTKEIWKYRPLGQNRYGLKITLENGRVTNWEQKS